MAWTSWLDATPQEAIFTWGGEQVLTREVDRQKAVWGDWVFHSTKLPANQYYIYYDVETNNGGQALTYTNTVGPDLHVEWGVDTNANTTP